LAVIVIVIPLLSPTPIGVFVYDVAIVGAVGVAMAAPGAMAATAKANAVNLQILKRSPLGQDLALT
jgi:hypothetical protein